ncbi:T. brucei spp.-specific protein [Trypanosoma brucei gambiense DAL972]|uniref:T. brucei spp.-specific protein n=1 Tax=Trypanosoma brucei gambiense (strain MHOM/CI/86/DAL972) TaxID=679716 RepID=C9ZKS9_TRYB9|nr:LOW QUALITY PROTEIN: T. brucei spp.-specific protein [Trypanosoma brucei gambiense DAL972]CBH10295.1 T. brucei spp.-specific protein [Trypanosoma brucei gambiense DAL972]|eukprot:XP_011772585.1 LOW QUALITY PROTEIN: T. brucei spp.-specific protein [Trypanosoma brucei gambiense DAL972]
MKNKYLAWCMFFCLKVVGGKANAVKTLRKETNCHTTVKALFNKRENCHDLASDATENEDVDIGTDADRWTACTWLEYDKRRTETQCILRFNNTYGEKLVCTYETKGNRQDLSCKPESRCEDARERYLLGEEGCPKPVPREEPKRNKTERCLDEVYGSFSGHQECAKLKIGSEVAEQIIFRGNGDDKTPECIEASGPPESKVVGEACVIKLRTEPHPSEYICKMEGSGEERKVKCTRETSKTIPQPTTTKKRRGSTGSMRKRSDDGGNTEVTLKEDKDETQDEDEGQKEEKKKAVKKLVQQKLESKAKLIGNQIILLSCF